MKILFVCLGNICRSPAAEGVMLNLLEHTDLKDKVSVDSAGTSGFHSGSLADQRMREHAKKRKLDLKSLSRKLIAEDLEKFDYIIVMDRSNYENTKLLDPEGKYTSKIYMLTDFCRHHSVTEVPDPYLGGASGFELVLDIITDGCTEFLKIVQAEFKEAQK